MAYGHGEFRFNVVLSTALANYIYKLRAYVIYTVSDTEREMFSPVPVTDGSHLCTKRLVSFSEILIYTETAKHKLVRQLFHGSSFQRQLKDKLCSFNGADIPVVCMAHCPDCFQNLN